MHILFLTGTYIWLFHYLAKFVYNCKIRSHFIITCTWNLAWPWSKLNVCVCKLCVFMCESINSEISWLNIKMQIIPPTLPQLSFSINILSSLSLPSPHSPSTIKIWTWSLLSLSVDASYYPTTPFLSLSLWDGWLYLIFFHIHPWHIYVKQKKLS